MALGGKELLEVIMDLEIDTNLSKKASVIIIPTLGDSPLRDV